MFGILESALFTGFLELDVKGPEEEAKYEATAISWLF